MDRENERGGRSASLIERRFFDRRGSAEKPRVARRDPSARPLATRPYFARMTQANTNKLFAIILDGQVISAPVIKEPIYGGISQISGSFTVESANQLAVALRSGALPVDLKIIEERSVGPDLGKDSIERGAIACLIALAATMALALDVAYVGHRGRGFKPEPDGAKSSIIGDEHVTWSRWWARGRRQQEDRNIHFADCVAVGGCRNDG